MTATKARKVIHREGRVRIECDGTTHYCFREGSTTCYGTSFCTCKANLRPDV